MKAPMITFGLSAAVLGTLTLAGAPGPALAADSTPTAGAVAEGVISAGTTTSLTLHPALGADVTLSLTTSTHFHPSPPPSTLVGQYARAQYNSANLQASDVWVRKPEPLKAAGLVQTPGTAGFTLTLSDGRSVGFTFTAQTVCRLNGQVVPCANLAQGDRAEVTFLLTPSANQALTVAARMAPPRSFDGQVGPSAPTADSFSATAGGQSLTFQIDSNTAVRINDRPARITDLVLNQPVHVLYRARGGGLLALRVSAGAAPKKEPHPELVAALKALEEAKNHLERAARDFGGYRARAAGQTDEAIKNVKAAMAFDAK